MPPLGSHEVDINSLLCCQLHAIIKCLAHGKESQVLPGFLWQAFPMMLASEQHYDLINHSQIWCCPW
jgi:hypothetical protein